MGAKTPKPIDRRILRTRRTLRDALIALIQERGFDRITVQDVCDRADVGRSTFYTHFADKEELLSGSFEDLKAALQAAAATRGRALGFVAGLIEHADEQRKVFRAVVGRRSSHVVQQRFLRLLRELVEDDLHTLAAPGPHRDATARYLAGALTELLSWWIDGKSGLSTEALEEHFHRLSAPALATLQDLERS